MISSVLIASSCGCIFIYVLRVRIRGGGGGALIFSWSGGGGGGGGGGGAGGHLGLQSEGGEPVVGDLLVQDYVEEKHADSLKLMVIINT